MARFLVIGDLHIHIPNLDETRLLISKLLDIAQNNEFDMIVILGDILDTNNIIKAEAHTLAILLLSKLSEIAPLLILMGNHDVPGHLSYFSDIHGFNALKLWQGSHRGNVKFPSGTGVQIVDTEVILFSINDVQFCALPYIPPGRFREALDTKEDWQQSKIIFCHQEFSYCDTGLGHRSSHGDNWTDDLPQIISGHIHKYQKLSTNILYSGTPRQVAITEDPYKTVSLISYQNGITETRISTTLPPRLHLKIQASQINTVSVPESGRIKIEITGTVSENIIAKRHLRLKEWRKKGFTVTFHDLIPEFDEVDFVLEERAKLGFKTLCRIKAEEQGLFREFEEIFG